MTLSTGCVYLAPVSVDELGAVAGALEQQAAVSLDGRYVAFTTAAALVPGDGNGVADVYRYDTRLKGMELVSATAGGAAGNAPSGEPSLSDDGLTVAFSSLATDLGPAVNGLSQVYLRHLPTGVNVLASANLGVPGNGNSTAPALSGDGGAIAFESLADNLDPADNNAHADIYRFVAAGPTLAWISSTPGGGAADGASFDASINSDGSSISFTSDATDLVAGDGNGVADVFLYAGGTIARASEGALGEADGASGESSLASGTGHLAFVSSATNLVPVDNNGVADIFLREPGGAVSRITEKSGFGFAAASSAPAISADGGRIAFQADGADVGSGSGQVAVVHDIAAGSFTPLSTSAIDKPALGAGHVTLSADGTYSGFVTSEGLDAADTNGIADVYLRFAYRGMLWPWSLSPGQVQDDTVVPITLRGYDFPVGGSTPSLKVYGAPTVSFAHITVVDAATITADMTVPAGVAHKSYQIELKFPGGGPGNGAGLTRTRRVLTVANPEPAADLVNIAAAAGFHSADSDSAGLHTADMNDDGFQDVLFITHNPTEEALYLGDGSTVTPLPVMFATDRHNCDSADVNGDGRTDIYCSVGSDKGSGSGDNGLFLQQPNGEYVDAAAAWGVTDPYGRGREVAFLHADNDGLPDLFVSNAAPRDDEFLSENRLFLNVANTAYAPAPGFGVDGELSSLCAMAVDFDDDGDDDLVVCGPDHLRMYANQAGAGFIDVSAALGLNFLFRDVDFADIDGDGDLDLAGARADRFVIYRLEDGAYVETLYTQLADHPWSVAFGDLDADTEPDVFFVQRGCRTEVEGNLPDFAARNDSAAFTALSVPPMSRGCGDAIVAFDHDGDGRDGFLVGNGRGRIGPLQYFILP